MMDTYEKDVLVIVSFSTKTNVLTLISCYDGSKELYQFTLKFCSQVQQSFYLFIMLTLI